MADVFISYASEDRDRAAQLASSLSAIGWSIWWDRKIITGQAFDHVIERELENAKSVIVLWSKHSIESEWVRNEAAVATERGVLVPATIESVKLPLEFRRKQTADLIDWRGETSHSGFQALCEGVTHTIRCAPPNQAILSQTHKSRRNPRGVLAAIATIPVVVGLGIYLIGPWRTSTPVPIPQSDRSKLGTPFESKKPPGAVTGLADLVIGTYFGNVVSDSKGGSRSDIEVTITKLDRYTVRVASDYQRIGIVDVTLTRSGNTILNVGGDSVFMLDLDKNPPRLAFSPRGLAYVGTKQN
jgi:hypothetical protein